MIQYKPFTSHVCNAINVLVCIITLSQMWRPYFLVYTLEIIGGIVGGIALTVSIIILVAYR